MTTAQPAKKGASAQDPTKPRSPDRQEIETVEIETVPLVVWTARLSAYFLALGGILLAVYAIKGLGTNPQSFPLGFQLDPIQAGLYFVWGAIGCAIGFYWPRLAAGFVLASAALLTLLAVLGTFTPYHLGMQLTPRVNLFHWLLAPFAWAIGLYGLWCHRVFAEPS
jgi:hypothetical protein